MPHQPRVAVVFLRATPPEGPSEARLFRITISGDLLQDDEQRVQIERPDQACAFLRAWLTRLQSGEKPL